MKKGLLFVICIMPIAAFGDIIADADNKLWTARIVCAGISDELAHISGIAKTDTIITTVGAAAGGGALAVGLSKADKDKKIAQLVQQMCGDNNCSAHDVKGMSYQDFKSNILEPMAQIAKIQTVQIEQAERASVRLGNWRTGLMAGNAATNIASAVIAGTNKNQSELAQHIAACNALIRDLNDARTMLQSAGVNPMIDTTMSSVINVLNACREIDVSDISKIEKRMAAVMGTGIAGAVVGITGVAVSASANSASVRNDNSDSGMRHEKNLNTAANVMSGVATSTSLVGAGLNVSLIGLTKKLIRQARTCEEAFQ